MIVRPSKINSTYIENFKIDREDIDIQKYPH